MDDLRGAINGLDKASDVSHGSMDITTAVKASEDEQKRFTEKARFNTGLSNLGIIEAN